MPFQSCEMAFDRGFRGCRTGPVRSGGWLSGSPLALLQFHSVLLSDRNPSKSIRTTLQPLRIVRIHRIGDPSFVLISPREELLCGELPHSPDAVEPSL